MQPTINAINFIAKNENNDCTEDLMHLYHGKVILQCIIIDLFSPWQGLGPFWIFSRTANNYRLWKSLWCGFMFDCWRFHRIPFWWYSIDFASTNISLVTTLTKSTVKQLKHRPIEVHVPFYYNIKHAVNVGCCSVHDVKKKRSAIAASRLVSPTLAKNGMNIVWDPLLEIYKLDKYKVLADCHVLNDASLHLDAWSKMRYMLAQNVFDPRVRSVMKERMDADPNIDKQWKELYNFLEIVWDTVIVTQCSPKQGNMIGYNGCVSSLDDKIFQALDRGYKYFAEWERTDPDTCLPDQLLLSIHSTFLGIPCLFRKILKKYHDPNDKKKLPAGQYINPYRLNNNGAEMNFCKARNNRNDLITNYHKYHEQQSMQTDIRLSQQKTKIKGNTVAAHRVKARLNSRQKT